MEYVIRLFEGILGWLKMRDRKLFGGLLDKTIVSLLDKDRTSSPLFVRSRRSLAADSASLRWTKQVHMEK
jgi:hypothetical protein